MLTANSVLTGGGRFTAMILCRLVERNESHAIARSERDEFLKTGLTAVFKATLASPYCDCLAAIGAYFGP